MHNCIKIATLVITKKLTKYNFVIIFFNNFEIRAKLKSLFFASRETRLNIFSKLWSPIIQHSAEEKIWESVSHKNKHFSGGIEYKIFKTSKIRTSKINYFNTVMPSNKNDITTRVTWIRKESKKKKMFSRSFQSLND